MDNLGTEVGQKMRSAIKAKLIELGTGSSSGGYIDDELPDYVMIMVANKRSIQQMTDDLSLFLGSNTNVFVVWLHQVLEKLQEVTLPANPVTVQQKKRKTSTSETSTRNEKKDKKKKTKNRERTPDLPPPAIESPNQTVPSITDVFAEQFIQKAKETIELEQIVTKKTKIQRDKTPPLVVINNRRSDNKYGTPFSTESSIKSAVEAHLHSKEIQELKELQEKIYQTKQQLKTMCSSDDEHQLNLETDDDFLNIRATEDDIEDVTGAIVSMKEKRSTRIPIIYNEKSPTLSSTKSRSRSDDSSKKKSVLDRLGTRNESYRNAAEVSVTTTTSPKSKNIISLAAHRREERELYTPHYRRLPISSSEKEISYTASRSVATKTNSENSTRKQNIKPTNYREREKTPEQRRDIRNRMGSRCVVIPPSSSDASNTYDESEIEVPVNSVVKIKPRPFIPPNKQANKYLLLRAVADAQKSTSAVKASFASVAGKKKYQNDKLPLIEKKNILKKTIQNTKVQNRNNTFYIEVKNTDANDDNSMYADEVEEDEGVDVVEEISDDYIEQTDFTEEDHPETDVHDHEMIPVEQDAIADEDEDTQFVVTLNIRHHDDEDKKSPVKLKRSIKDRIGIKNKDMDTVSPPAVKPKISTADSTTEIKKKTKIVINRNNNNTESIKRKSSYDRESNKIDEVKKSKVSPINFNLTDDEAKSSHDGDTEQLDDEEIRRKLLQDIKIKKNRGKSINAKQQKSNSNESHRTNITDEAEKQFTPPKKIKKLESTRKFDNVPEVLSAISIPALESAIVSTGKSKMTKIDRCKFFPFCNQGESCDFMHPTVNCKLFPNCKFGNNCNYIHPKCKFDKTCFRSDCNFAHSIKLPQTMPNTSASASPSISTSSTMPPLASSVVPVQNYKTISASSMPAICKFYPNCTNGVCNFYHPPKMCRWGKNCNNKLECNFYHHDLPTPFKWVSPFSI